MTQSIGKVVEKFWKTVTHQSETPSNATTSSNLGQQNSSVRKTGKSENVALSSFNEKKSKGY